MSVTAEVISIGDELTSGQRLDTNCQWLSQRLTELGISTVFHTTVADDMDAMISVFRAAVARCGVVVATGGLGPTADDLTRDVIAAVAGVEQKMHEPSLRHIRRIFTRHKREMSPSNERQAYFPEGSNVIPNPHGTAPGIDLIVKIDDRASRIFALPGVPAELKSMWEDYVGPRLQSDVPAGRVIRHHSIHCFGAGESQIESRLPDLIRRGRTPQVGITASKATISLRITAIAETEDQCKLQIDETATVIYEELGELIFGHSDEKLQDIVVGQMAEQQLTLAIVDFDLNGIVGAWLSSADKDRSVYKGGWLLTGEQDLLETADRAKSFFDADVILAIGRLERTGQGAQRSFAILGLADPIVDQYDGNCHPELLLQRSAKQVLNRLRLELQSRICHG